MKSMGIRTDDLESSVVVYLTELHTDLELIDFCKSKDKSFQVNKPSFGQWLRLQLLYNQCRKSILKNISLN